MAISDKADVSERPVRSAETPNLVGDSMVNRDDSNLVREAGLKTPESTSKLLDSPTNKFEIYGAGSAAEDLREKKKFEHPTPIRAGDNSSNWRTPDGSERTIMGGDGSKTTINFDEGGDVRSREIRRANGSSTRTEYGSDGRAEKVFETGPDGKVRERRGEFGDRVDHTRNADGSTNVSFKNKNGYEGYVYDKDKDLQSTYRKAGDTLSYRTYDKFGVLESTGAETVRDGVRTISTTYKGESHTVTSDVATGRKTSESLSTQFDQKTGKFDGSYLRKDDIRYNKDGTQDHTTKFNNDPDYTYKTHFNLDGSFRTMKENDRTREQWEYRRGHQKLRL